MQSAVTKVKNEKWLTETLQFCNASIATTKDIFHADVRIKILHGDSVIDAHRFEID